MWSSLIQMVKNDEKDALVKNCMNRGVQAIDTIYVCEEMAAGSIWRSDPRCYEHSMAILYERYCYAMSMIINQFCVKYADQYGRHEAFRSGITFSVAMNECTDALFKLKTGGLAFKKGTDDIRESVAIPLIHKLLQEGATVSAYDPKAMSNARKLLADKVLYGADAKDVIDDADCVFIMTDWDEFKDKDLYKGKIVIDGRRVLAGDEREGIKYEGLCW